MESDKHGITLIPAYIPTHLNMEGDYLSQQKLEPEWHLLPHIVQAGFQLLRQLELDLLAASHTNPFQLYYTLEWPLPPEVLGLNAFNQLWKFQVGYLFLPPILIPLVVFLAEHVTSQLRFLILVAPCWLEASLLPTVLNMLEDVPCQWSIVKDLITI